MATIDIREECEDVTKIYFADEESVQIDPHHPDQVIMKYEDSEEHERYRVAIRDIDNLIKALHKAKSLWT